MPPDFVVRPQLFVQLQHGRRRERQRRQRRERRQLHGLQPDATLQPDDPDEGEWFRRLRFSSE